jgi:hypothetical protein
MKRKRDGSRIVKDKIGVGPSLSHKRALTEDREKGRVLFPLASRIPTACVKLLSLQPSRRRVWDADSDVLTMVINGGGGSRVMYTRIMI